MGMTAFITAMNLIALKFLLNGFYYSRSVNANYTYVLWFCMENSRAVSTYKIVPNTGGK